MQNLCIQVHVETASGTTNTATCTNQTLTDQMALFHIKIPREIYMYQQGTLQHRQWTVNCSYDIRPCFPAQHANVNSICFHADIDVLWNRRRNEWPKKFLNAHNPYINTYAPQTPTSIVAVQCSAHSCGPLVSAARPASHSASMNERDETFRCETFRANYIYYI